MTEHSWHCDACGTTISGAGMEAFIAELIAHGRDVEKWPFSDMAIRNFGEASQRCDGPTDRLASIGEVDVHRVDESRVDDFLHFFDRDAFADNFAWASCYCTEPYVLGNAELQGAADQHWTERRALMQEWLRTGKAGGYLAYVDGKVGGWANATIRRDYSRWRLGDDASPPDKDVLAVACFVIAPPYRRHGLASKLLEAVIADAPSRGVRFIEAYPNPKAAPNPEFGLSVESANYHGPYEMYVRFGFEPAGEREDGKFVAMRRAVYT